MKVFVYLALVFAALSLGHISTASRIAFHANPNNINPVLTEFLKLRCAIIEDTINGSTHDRRDLMIAPMTQLPSTTTHPTARPTPPHANMEHIMSMLISRRNRTTGRIETVAEVSPYDLPTANVDHDNIHVDGNFAYSPVSKEKGFLEVSWYYPTEAQTGDYFCDVYSLDPTLHPVSLSGSARITALPLTLADLTGFVVQNERYIAELKKELSVLRQESDIQAQAVVNTTYSINNLALHLKSQNIQAGTFNCVANTYIAFPKPFEALPVIYTSVSDFQTAEYTSTFSVAIQNLTVSGFKPVCVVSQGAISKVQWLAIDN